MGVAIAIEEEDETVVEVWEENWDAVRLFLALGTQWRVMLAPVEGGARVLRLGIDYAAIGPVRRALGLRRRRRNLFGQLRGLEAAALEAFAEAGR